MTIRPVRDYTPYLKHAREQAARHRADPQIAARRERAWVVARQIADFLRREYQPTRIVVFGSLVHPKMFGLRSDIDIAVPMCPLPPLTLTSLPHFSEIPHHMHPPPLRQHPLE